MDPWSSPRVSSDCMFEQCVCVSFGIMLFMFWGVGVGGGGWVGFFFSSRRRHTRLVSDWSSDVCSSDLSLAEGGRFNAPDDVVLGAAVARELNYSLGDEIIIAHGLQSVSFAEHKDDPFTVVGILAPTGTQIGRASCRERV